MTVALPRKLRSYDIYALKIILQTVGYAEFGSTALPESISPRQLRGMADRGILLRIRSPIRSNKSDYSPATYRVPEDITTEVLA